MVPLGGVLGNDLGTLELVVFGNLLMGVLLMSVPISDGVSVNWVKCLEGPACELAFPTLDPDNPMLCPEGPAWELAFVAGAFALLPFSVPSETPSLVPPTVFAFPLSTAPVDLDYVLVGRGGGGDGARPGVCCGLFLILVFFILVLAPVLPFLPLLFFFEVMGSPDCSGLWLSAESSLGAASSHWMSMRYSSLWRPKR